ncbi:MAG TPA: ABC transporter ATP-binding protein [Verrucomicrobiae bacterium]
MSCPRPIIETQNLWKFYERGKIEVLRGVSFCISPGEIVALCGPSGGGKSTLLHLISGLDKPDKGAVYLEGTELSDARTLLHALRHKIGFVFQLHNLIPDLTLRENCLIPSIASGQSSKKAQARFLELAERTGLAHRQNHRIQDLSGGERQRTAICRALMNSPSLIMADEPTGSLDEKSREQVFGLLVSLVREDKATLVMATHDRSLAEQCDRLMVVKDGRVFESAEVR